MFPPSSFMIQVTSLYIIRHQYHLISIGLCSGHLNLIEKKELETKIHGYCLLYLTMWLLWLVVFISSSIFKYNVLSFQLKGLPLVFHNGLFQRQFLLIFFSPIYRPYFLISLCVSFFFWLLKTGLLKNCIMAFPWESYLHPSPDVFVIVCSSNCSRCCLFSDLTLLICEVLHIVCCMQHLKSLFV